MIALNKKGYKTNKLKFVKYSDFRTFTYNQTGYEFETRGGKTLLYLSKIGYVEIRQHRNIPQNCIIKQIIITKSKSGKWYACVTCNIDVSIQNIQKIEFKKIIGIDVGIKSFAYDSDGHQTPNP